MGSGVAVSKRAWLKSQRQRQKNPPADPPGPPEEDFPDPPDPEGLPCVVWKPVRCYFCGSTHKTSAGPKNGMRWHTCQGCGRKYKSLEIP